MLVTERDRSDVVTAAGVALQPNTLSVVPLAELQVRRAVVPSVAVDMVHGLPRAERAAEQLRHDESMFGDDTLRVGVRVLRTVSQLVTSGAVGNVGPFADRRPCAVSRDVAVRVSRVLPSVRTGRLGDSGPLSAAAFTESGAFLDLSRSVHGVATGPVTDAEAQRPPPVVTPGDDALPSNCGALSAPALTEAGTGPYFWRSLRPSGSASCGRLVESDRHTRNLSMNHAEACDVGGQ